MKEKGQKLKICAKKARAANKRRVAFLAKIATRWIYFIHIFRQLLVPNLSKSEQKNSVLALGAYYTDYNDIIRHAMPLSVRGYELNLVMWPITSGSLKPEGTLLLVHHINSQPC